MNLQRCARPGCPEQPVAWLAYDYQARCAWLDGDEIDEDEQASRWPLCERHANTLRVPKGWFCVDSRLTAAGSVAGPAADEAARPGTGKGKAARISRLSSIL